MTTFLFEAAWKSTAVALVTLLVLNLLRSLSASERALIARLGLVAILLTPLAIVFSPAVFISIPEFVSVEHIPADLRAETAWNVPFWVIGLYFASLALLSAHGAVALARLTILRSQADVVVDAVWLSALAAAQKRAGHKHGTALLENRALQSPVSWGFMRPTILLADSRPVNEAEANAIVAHELNHVLRLDWIAMLVGRAATTLFWFNPLVWQLARENQQLSEEAADDAVLKSVGMPSADYARLLLDSARRHLTTPRLPAQGVVSERRGLGRRMARVLASNPPRRPVPRVIALAGLALVLGLTACLGAVHPLPPATWAVSDSPARTAEASATRLALMSHPQAQALGRALVLSSWPVRRVDGHSRFYEPGAIEALAQASLDGRPVNRRIAVWGLSEIDPKRAVADGAMVTALAALEVRLQDPHPSVRGQAARALADLGHAESVISLIGLLEDPDQGVRRDAAHALGDLQSPEAIEPLTAALTDIDASVRARAAWALERCKEAASAVERARTQS